MLRLKPFFGVLLFCTLASSSLGLQALAFECAPYDTCSFLRPSVDTTHTFAIYSCGAETLYTLPPYCGTVWQEQYLYSIPRFFTDNSMEKYALTCDPIVDGLSPIQHPSLDPDARLCTGGGNDFLAGIFEIADSTVDFADYDGDGDAVVDGFFFVILGDYYEAKGCACLGDFSYKTDDTTPTGDTIEIAGQRGVEIRIRMTGINPPPTERHQFVHVCVHEWGHQFGLLDLHGT